MPLMTKNSNFLPAGTRILNHVGKAAPPRPTMPDARTQSMNDAVSVYSGILSVGSASILPSDSISTTWAV